MVAGWKSSNAGMMSRMIAIYSSLLNVSRQALFHGVPSFERSQNCVCHYRSAAENVVAQSVGQRVQNRHATGANRRLADTARADRRFRIGNVNRIPLHVHRNVQDGGRTVGVEALGLRPPVMLVVNPFLPGRVADAEHGAAENRAAERGGVK